MSLFCNDVFLFSKKHCFFKVFFFNVFGVFCISVKN